MRVDELSDAELALRPHRITGPVMAAFLAAGAVQPAAAMGYRPATPGAKAELERLILAGVVRQAPGGAWFDLRRHYAVRRAREVRWMIGSVVAALIGAAIVVLFYQG